MNSLLFGFLPALPLPGSFAHAYPDLVTVHFVLSFFGVIIFLFSVCFLAVFLFLCLTRSLKKNCKKVAKEVLLSFLWAFGFGFFGLYIFSFVPMVVGAMGYRQYS